MMYKRTYLDHKRVYLEHTKHKKLYIGHKRTCPCGSVKYYDFYQDVINCPECGKSIEAVNIAKPKRGRKAGISVATPIKTAKENDELKDLIEETEDTAEKHAEVEKESETEEEVNKLK